MRNLVRRCLFGVVLFAAAHGNSVLGYDNCNTYYNSRIVSSYQYGTYCGSTGNTCTYCWDNDLGAYCYSNSPAGCSIDHQNY
jgi:hypothetical protein